MSKCCYTHFAEAEKKQLIPDDWFPGTFCLLYHDLLAVGILFSATFLTMSNIWIMPLILLTPNLCSQRYTNVFPCSSCASQRKQCLLRWRVLFFHCQIINWNLISQVFWELSCQEADPHSLYWQKAYLVLTSCKVTSVLLVPFNKWRIKI